MSLDGDADRRARWRDLVERRRPEDRLCEAIALGEAVLAGTADLRALNRRSLVLRGKATAEAR